MSKANTSSQGRLIAFRADRLGGRLISLINTMRLAQTFDLPMVVHWRDSDDLDNPTDIFGTKFVADHFIDKPTFQTMRAEGAPIASLMGSATAEAFKAELSTRHAIVDPPFDILTLPFEDPDKVKADFIQIAQSLPLNPLLAERLEAVRKDFTSDTRSIAYHIRRGDLTADRRAMNKAWPNKFVPDEFFEAHMRANLTDTSRVILFSDNANVLARYKAMFPSLLTFDDIADATGLNAPQKDALELFTMAMADQLIAPPSSAFSSTAKTIGGAAFDDVESQLDPDTRADALDLLTTRLRDTPEVFANEGEIGQYLVYARDHLVAQNKGGTFADIAADHIRKGLNIAFIHAMAAREMYFDGQYQTLVDLKSDIDKGFVIHSRSFAHLTFYLCLSLLMLDRKQEAIGQISTAFWLEPTEGEINALVGILEGQGDLGRHNFWFSDPVVERVFNNKFLIDFVKRFFLPLVNSYRLTVDKPVPNSRLKIWEWPYFAKSDVGKQYRYKGHFRDTLKILKRHRWDGQAQIHMNSFMGLMALREGDMEQAKSLLFPACKAIPDNALFQKRIADYYLAEEKFSQALKAINQAIELEPNTAMFAAFKGLIQLRKGDHKVAAKTFKGLLDPDRLCIPGVYFIAGEAFEGAGQPKQAAAAIAKGLALAPMDWKRQVALAQLEQELGEIKDATARMRWTAEWADERPPVIKTLSDLLLDGGAADEARDMLLAARTRYPKKPQFAKMHEKLTAKLAKTQQRAARKASVKKQKG